ncbi:hypothetical protein CEXT_533361 [Caerostris extrusa]|uniref:Uncharacterized protein n=1 Tax=Caerostris extrusa TaxID=172846 RepID=A0AAV4PSM6_CAEEX|nr:hypothetical protein CEXT_533361 [Caerostris extrusa]
MAPFEHMPLLIYLKDYFQSKLANLNYLHIIPFKMKRMVMLERSLNSGNMLLAHSFCSVDMCEGPCTQKMKSKKKKKEVSRISILKKGEISPYLTSIEASG